MSVTVHLFGHYSDFVGGEPIEMTLPEGATARELAKLLTAQNARLNGIATHCRCAINEEYADYDTPLTEGSVVAFIPPMSGG